MKIVKDKSSNNGRKVMSTSIPATPVEKRWHWYTPLISVISGICLIAWHFIKGPILIASRYIALGSACFTVLLFIRDAPIPNNLLAINIVIIIACALVTSSLSKR